MLNKETIPNIAENENVKLMNFLKKSSILYSMVQTNVVYSNADQGRIYKNLNMNFFTPRTGVLVLG